MESALNQPVSQGKLLPEQREALLRLLESSSFASSPRLRSVLSYLMQALEEGSSDAISEQSVGQAVFGRPAGYNASEDNIVRVTVRHLRTRLDEYYASEGIDDGLILVIPKGKYVPSFVPRPERSLAKASLPESAQKPVDVPLLVDTSHTSPVEITTKRHIVWRWLPLGVALVFAAGYGIRTLHSLRPPSPPGGILGALLPKGSDITVVAVDGNLQAYRTIFGKQVSLDNYISRTYATQVETGEDPRIAKAREFAAGTDQTNISSAIIGAAMQQDLTGRRVLLRHPHSLSVRAFEGPESVILLGGPWSDPWGQLFESRFNFRIVPEPDNPSTPEVHNLHPAQGEAALYRPHQDGALAINYVRIAIIPNLDGTGHVILLSATSAGSLEAASNYLLSPVSEHELMKHFGVSNVDSLPPVEFLLKVSGLDSIPTTYRILAFRIVH